MLHSDTFQNSRQIRIARCMDIARAPAGALDPPPPIAAYLELTPACNNRCPGCSNTDFIADFDQRMLRPGRGRPLSGTEWELLFDRLGPSVRFLNLTGGEAALHPDFEAIVTSINRRAIDFVLFTNGRWRDPARLVALLAGLPTCRGLLISLHGASEATHDAFTGVNGSFDETLANIRLAAGAGLRVHTSSVITHQSVPELERIVELSRQLHARETVFNRYLVPESRQEGLGSMTPSHAELRAAVNTIEGLRSHSDETHGVSYGPCIPQCFAPSSSSGCAAGDAFFVVDPWGNVKPCTDTSLYCGNLRTQTLEEIWTGPQMRSWRGLIPDGCSSCAALADCRTGCRAMALSSRNGRDPLMTKPLPTSRAVRDVALPIIPLVQ
jgi:radical SAM protein with 4Fe4S-binding SPASM domain